MYEAYARLRDSKGVSDYQVAKDTGITRSSFTAWKNGDYAPKVDKLKKLADYFGVDIKVFIS